MSSEARITFAVPVLGGVKFTGRMGPWTVGLLDTYIDGTAATDERPRIDEQNLGVLRVQRALGAGQSIGGVVTTGDPDGTAARATYGIDSRFGSSDLCSGSLPRRRMTNAMGEIITK